MAFSSFPRNLRILRSSAPAIAAAVGYWNSSEVSHCEAEDPPSAKTFGMRPEVKGDFHNLFPKRQLWKPKLEYPLWDNNWDGQQLRPSGDADRDRKRLRHLRKTGVTKHIILVRHGQYDETQREDEKRVLTPLGRQQAEYTGKRLKEIMDGASKEFGPCKIKVVRVSNMARAMETADIIASHLPGVERSEPDPDLNEGRPAHNIPGGKASPSTIQKTDENHPRIEQAFQRYFRRAPPPDNLDEEDDGESSDTDDSSKNEFEIIVCHANVIRYFFCRALQLPPETWLRFCTFNCSLTYLTIRPTGTVSARMLGDIGHLPYGMSTFSMHPGFNW